MTVVMLQLKLLKIYVGTLLSIVKMLVGTYD